MLAMAAAGAPAVANDVHESADAIERALLQSSRPEAARAQDPARQPEAVLRLAGIGAGDVVLELAPGAGYYTGLLSRVVGNAGWVIAVDPYRLLEHDPQASEVFPSYQLQDPRPNVDYMVQRLDSLDVPGDLDQAWMVRYYEQTVRTGVDRTEMNQRIFDALKPGGVFLVVDQAPKASAAGGDMPVVDAPLARQEIEAAGFVLQNPATELVDQRGSERVVYRFVKPEQVSGRPGAAPAETAALTEAAPSA